MLKERYNSGVKYGSKTWNWDTVIQLKTQELASFLLEKSNSVDFIEPTPNLERGDSREIRRRILELTEREAKEIGMSKSTLNYLRRNASSDHSFRVYHKIYQKLHVT